MARRLKPLSVTCVLLGLDKVAINTLKPGDAITIFTPDPTHFEIAKYAIERGIHVLVTKPAVMTIEEHLELIGVAKRHNVLVMVEFHKVHPLPAGIKHSILSLFLC